jgi:hypothetical protein
MLSSDRNGVVHVQNARGTNGSPVVLGPRALENSEFWDFVALEGTGRDPTSDFVRASSAADLANAVQRGWGTVIKVDPSAQLGLFYVDQNNDATVVPRLR